MSYTIGLILAGWFTLIVAGALLVRTAEHRELARSAAAILGFWTLIIAILS